MENDGFILDLNPASFLKYCWEKLKTGYDTGLKLNIIENYLELYFPILNSEKYILNSNNYSKNIRFTLVLDSDNLTNLFTRRWF